MMVGAGRANYYRSFSSAILDNYIFWLAAHGPPSDRKFGPRLALKSYDHHMFSMGAGVHHIALRTDENRV
jgi:hypothetical protein